jgi:hypothetical protein
MCTPRLLLLALSSAALACSAADDDCRCLVQSGAERRAIACGEAACVGDRNVSCADRDQIVERGQCLASPGRALAPNEPQRPPANGAQPAAGDAQSCEQLLGYCGASCTAPAATAADCQATASAGGLQACRDWPLANGVLCRP